MLETKVRKYFIKIIVDNLGWVILGIIIIIASLIMPKFGTWKNLRNIVLHAIPLGLSIYAMTLCLMSGNFDLSLESTYALSPIIAVLCMEKLSASILGCGIIGIIGIIITILIGALIGLINGVISKKLVINPFLVTLCTMMIFRGLALYLVPASIFGLPKSYIYLGNDKIFSIPMILIVFILITIILHLIISKRVFGRQTLATGSNLTAAFYAGLPVVKIQIKVFISAGILAAISGLLATGRQGAVFNQMGEGTIMLMFAGAILGGASLKGGSGDIRGALSGILILQTISNLLTLSGVDPFITKAVHGMILLFAVLLQSGKEKFKERL